jgi:hypothetical protein
LKSFDTHWEGLTVFVDHPQIPMDNNGSYADIGIRAVMPTSGLCRVVESLPIFQRIFGSPAIAYAA